jgi:hypothetical protein
MKYGFILVFSILLNACASIPSFQSKDNLSPYLTNKKIALDSDAIYKVNKGMATWYFGVNKGEYTAKYQDDSGCYFEGLNYSSCMGTEGKSGGCTSHLIGGIWQSKMDQNDFRMYDIDGSLKNDNSNTQGYALTLNKYVIETESVEFANLIKASL